MTLDDITDWMAYELSLNCDFKEQVEKEKLSRPLTPNEEAEAIRNLFLGL
jgi:hypothetical protein